MKKKVFLILSIALLSTAVISAGFATGAFSTEAQEQSIWSKLGRIETQESAAANGIGEDVAYVGDHITITQADYDRYLQRAQLAAPGEDVSQTALRNIAMREIYCYRGKEAGIPDDDEAFAQWLAEYRAAIESADNYSDFETFTGGADMTPEEYWHWAETSETFRKEYYASLFTAQLQEEFRQGQGASLTSETFNDAWIAYMKEYKEQAIADEHLKKADGSAIE